VFSVLCSTDDTSFHVFGTLFHWWQQFSCFRYSAPPMAPVFMFSVFCSTDGTSFHVFGTLLHWWHQLSYFRYTYTYHFVFDGRKNPFTTSANASSVSSICNHLINNWCRQIVKYNTVISLLVIICNFVFVLITGALFFYFCISVNYKVHFIVTSSLFSIFIILAVLL
jgi:hypothetical protein